MDMDKITMAFCDRKNGFIECEVSDFDGNNQMIRADTVEAIGVYVSYDSDFVSDLYVTSKPIGEDTKTKDVFGFIKAEIKESKGSGTYIQFTKSEGKYLIDYETNDIREIVPNKGKGARPKKESRKLKGSNIWTDMGFRKKNKGGE